MASDNLELLGVTIDCGLNFNLHISNACKKASQRMVVIMRLRWNLIPTEAKLHLFKEAILPHLTYCHLVWHFVEPQTPVDWREYRNVDGARYLKTSSLATSSC